MGRIVILEGPDGGGKTTLARELMKWGFEYKHEGPPPEGVDLVSHYLKIIDESLKSPSPVIHDRLWLGERIYGPVSRGKDNLGLEGQKLFMRLHKSKSIDMYLVWPNINVARENYKVKMKEKDDYLANRNLPGLNARKIMDDWESIFVKYCQWAYNHGTIGTLYDYTVNRPHEVFDDVMRDSTKRYLPDGVVGNPKAKYLFIGDQPNHSTIDIPFFALNGSSGYLNTAIERAGIKEEDLALANAHSVNGTQFKLKTIMDSLPDVKEIFLLGNRAVQWFTNEFRKPPFTTSKKVHILPHPSYLKRFKGHNPEVMAQLIREKLNGCSN